MAVLERRRVLSPQLVKVSRVARGFHARQRARVPQPVPPADPQLVAAHREQRRSAPRPVDHVRRAEQLRRDRVRAARAGRRAGVNPATGLPGTRKAAA